MITSPALMLQVVSSWQHHLQGMVDGLERAVKQPPPLLALPGIASPLDSVPKLSECHLYTLCCEIIHFPISCSCPLDVAHQVEALHELQGVLSLGSLCPPSLAQAAYYTLALLYTTIKDYHQVCTHVPEASWV